MTTRRGSKPAAETPETDDVPELPTAGTLVRLDDPDAGGEPRFAISAGPGVGVIDLGPVRVHELGIYPADAGPAPETPAE